MSRTRFVDSNTSLGDKTQQGGKAFRLGSVLVTLNRPVPRYHRNLGSMKDAACLGKHHSADTLPSARGFPGSPILPNRGRRRRHFQGLATRRCSVTSIGESAPSSHASKPLRHTRPCSRLEDGQWPDCSRCGAAGIYGHRAGLRPACLSPSPCSNLTIEADAACGAHPGRDSRGAP
jgi:hypothetical protein